MKSSQSGYKVWERTITRRGGSYTIVLPEPVIEHLDLSEGQQLCILIVPNKKYAIISNKRALDLKTTLKFEGKDVGVEVFRSLFTEKDLLELVEALKTQK